MTSTPIHLLTDRFPLAVADHTRKLEPPSRPPAGDEIEALQRMGTHCVDWSRIRVAPGFDPERVVGCHLMGDCYLGQFEDGSEDLPEGVYYSSLRNSIIESGASVHRCSLVDSYRICSGARVVDAALRCGARTTFGNGTRIDVGIETGGRGLTLVADLTLDLVVELCRNPGRWAADGELRRLLADYLGGTEASVGYVGCGARVRHCASVEDSWIGDGAIVDSATLVSNTTVLSSAQDPVIVGAGSIVRHSILHPGSEVTDSGLVDRSLMLEHSQVERHGKLTASVLGPNSGVAEGEATASVIGPFTAFHHQALLIAAYWPAGKGNVGYGANVGSNHTSRLPDQEIWPGEGMFFGLGCNVKFPADFSRSPYTIISTGVTTLPQRLEMPFSVIATPTTDEWTPPGIMQLKPAWVLKENIYALLRNEAKYRKRNMARSTVIELSVFREDIAVMMRTARGYLSRPATGKKVYLPGDLPGIGKNFVTEDDRRTAIDIYDRYLEYSELERAACPYRSSGALAEIDENGMKALTRYLEHRRLMLEDARRSRNKDWQRGISCIDDYADTHPPVDQDELITSLEKEIAGLEALV